MGHGRPAQLSPSSRCAPPRLPVLRVLLAPRTSNEGPPCLRPACLFRCVYIDAAHFQPWVYHELIQVPLNVLGSHSRVTVRHETVKS